MLQALQKELNQSLKMVEKIKEIIEILDDDVLRESSQLQLEKMKKLEFHIVVLGQFKRGKSTLINYFLGDEVLPTGVIPITAMVTKLKYAKEPKAVIVFENGSTKTFSTKEAEAYIAEPQNPKNVKKVKEIEIFYPSTFLENGVVIVDTPGIGSSHKHNTEAAYGYISEADAAIFVVSSDAPIGEIELEFLEDVKKHMKKIFFVQNKIDYFYSDEDKKQSIDFSTKTIKDSIEYQPRIYPIAAKLAYEGKKENNGEKIKTSGIEIFERDLEAFLTNEKGYYLVNSYKSKIAAILGKLLDYVNFNINVLNSTVENLEKQLDTFHAKFKDTDGLKVETMAIVQVELERIIQDFSERLQQFRLEKEKEIKGNIMTWAEEHKDCSSKELYNSLNQYMEEEIERVYNSWNKDQEIYIRKEYKEIISKFTIKLNETIVFINDLTNNLFKIRIGEPMEDFELAEKDSFYFKFGAPKPVLLVPTIKDFMLLLPKKIRDKKILENVLGRVDKELEKNGNNLKWDYMCKIRDSKYIFENTFTDKTQSIQEKIEVMISRTMALKNQESHKIEKDIERFENIKTTLKAMQGEMTEI